MPRHQLTRDLVWAILARTATTEPELVHDLMIDLTPWEAADALTTRRLPSSRAHDLADLAARDLDQAAHLGARLVTAEDPTWPLSTDTAARLGAPVALWVRGRLQINRFSQLRVAITGAAVSTLRGRQVTAEFTEALVSRKWQIVSGTSFGIDAEALSTTLAHGGTPIAVSPVGLAHTHPFPHRSLLDQVASTGLVISLSPPGQRSLNRAMHRRCRYLLADLTQALVVPEAGYRAPALHAVDRARELDRPVLVSPGPAAEAASHGCRDLIAASRAVPISNSAKLLYHLNHDPRTWMSTRFEHS